MLLLVLHWGAVVVFLAVAPVGPRRWHQILGVHLRPGSEAPTPRGQLLLHLGAWTRVAVVVVLAPVLSPDLSGFDEDETTDASTQRPAVDVPPGRCY